MQASAHQDSRNDAKDGTVDTATGRQTAMELRTNTTTTITRGEAAVRGEITTEAATTTDTETEITEAAAHAKGGAAPRRATKGARERPGGGEGRGGEEEEEAPQYYEFRDRTGIFNAKRNWTTWRLSEEERALSHQYMRTVASRSGMLTIHAGHDGGGGGGVDPLLLTALEVRFGQ